MDENKLKKLKEIGYKIQECCGVCNFRNFNLGAEFGMCLCYKYEHKKHTESKRHLSINRYGHCRSFRWSADFLVNLKGFREFVAD